MNDQFMKIDVVGDVVEKALVVDLMERAVNFGTTQVEVEKNDFLAFFRINRGEIDRCCGFSVFRGCGGTLDDLHPPIQTGNGNVEFHLAICFRFDRMRRFDDDVLIFEKFHLVHQLSFFDCSGNGGDDVDAQVFFHIVRGLKFVIE